MQVPGYQIEGPFTAGAYSFFWSVKDTRGAAWALRILPTQTVGEIVIDRWEALWHKPHPGLAALHEVKVIDSDRIALIVELVSGVKLDTWLGQTGQAGTAEACRLGYQVAEALAHIHQLGLVHGNVSPANILVAEKAILIDTWGLPAGNITEFPVGEKLSPELDIQAWLKLTQVLGMNQTIVAQCVQPDRFISQEITRAQAALEDPDTSPAVPASSRRRYKTDLKSWRITNWKTRTFAAISMVVVLGVLVGGYLCNILPSSSSASADSISDPAETKTQPELLQSVLKDLTAQRDAALQTGSVESLPEFTVVSSPAWEADQELFQRLAEGQIQMRGLETEIILLSVISQTSDSVQVKAQLHQRPYERCQKAECVTTPQQAPREVILTLRGVPLRVYSVTDTA